MRCLFGVGNTCGWYFPATMLILVLNVAVGFAQQPAAFDDDAISVPGLDVEFAAGWEDVADTSTAVPIALLLNNVSREPVDGWLVLSDPWGGEERFLEEIYLTGGQKRRYSTIQSLSGWNRCMISIRRKNGEILFQRDLPISRGSGTSDTHNTALIINDSTLTLQLAKTAAKPGKQFSGMNRNGRYYYLQDRNSQSQVYDEKGRSVRSLNVKTWQIPSHPAPLQRAAAVVFSEGVETFNINGGQWKALARYVCDGGSLFVNDAASEVVEQLKSRSPLLPDPPMRIRSFDVRRMGLGRIYVYSGKLFGGDDQGNRRVSQEISRLVPEHPAELIRLPSQYSRESGRADMNRLLVGSFFGLYAVLSGIGTLVMFRKTQKRVKAYVATVVLGGCLAAVALGGTMRMSHGDVYWVSVTEGGAGGVVEYAKIEVQSAGNRNSRLRINASQPDLQVVTRPRRYYYHSSFGAIPPFTWQPNQAKSEAEAYEVEFSITPWGVRHLRATSYQSGIRKPDVELHREGTSWQFKMTNYLPVTLTDCWLYVSVADEKGNVWKTAQSLNDLTTGQTAEKSFQKNAHEDHGSNFQQHTEFGSLYPNRSQRKGTTRAWIAARVTDATQMQISGQSDFVATQSAHFYLQDLLPEQIH